MKKRAVWIALLAGAVVAIVTGQTEQEFLAHNDVTSGSELFRMYCASCHGVDGRGDGPVAEALKHKPADLTTISKRNRGEFPAFRIEHMIDGYEVRYAHGTRDMPVWGSFFGDMKRDDNLMKLREHNLSEYIRSLQR